MRLGLFLNAVVVGLLISCGGGQPEQSPTAEPGADNNDTLDTEQRLDAGIGAEGQALEERFAGKSLRQRAELLISLPIPEGLEDLSGLAMIRDYLANRSRDAHDLDMTWTMANEEAEQYLRSASGSTRVYLRQVLAIIGDIYTAQSGM